MIKKCVIKTGAEVAKKIGQHVHDVSKMDVASIKGGTKKLGATLDCMACANQPMIAGKHKIPRYLYHFTSEKNYQSMLKDGYILPNGSDILLDNDAIFMVDLVNFLKDWKKRPEWNNEDLSWQLLAQTYTHGDKKLVLLRIPTRKLDAPDNLVIRSQKEFFSCDNNSFDDAAEMDEYFDGLHFDEDMDFFNATRLTLEKFHPEIAQRMRFGDKAIYAPLYRQRGEAFEFAYKGKIPMENVELVGRASFPNEECIDVFEAMTQFLNGNPEEKMLALLY